jgi:hypothetical protein
MDANSKEILMATGLPGMLIGLLAAVMIGFAIYKLTVRQMSWKLFWLGGASFVLGAFGTVIAMMNSFDRVAGMGGAANPSDLSRGIAHSLASSALGIGALLLSGILTSLLYAFAKPAGNKHEEAKS